MNHLLELDKSISVAINGAHSPFLDSLMVFVSRTSVWIPLYLLVLLLIIHSNRKSWKTILINVVGLVVTFALTDFLSTLVKDSVCRLRPCYEPSLEGIVRVIVNKGGLYGFFSSHAANVFGFAILSAIFLRRKWYTVSILFWANLIAYSRIYLAKHYFGDVLCGALFGLLMACLIHFICKRIMSGVGDPSPSH